MPGERVATDVVGDELVAVYVRAARKLERLIAAGLRRGLDADRVGAGEQVRGDATQAYRERQLRLAREVIDELEASAAPFSRGVTARAYRSALFALDPLVTPAGALAPAFGGIHQGAVSVLAGNLERSLAKTADTLRESVETVFARAAELEGPLPAAGVARMGFVGRRVDDAWRRVALEELGAGQVTLETRRQISASLVRRLLDEGVTDGVTGFVDRAGKRWRLDVYAEMAVRTTTREATSRATANRLAEHGLGLITISSHPHKADICTPYDGRTFALPGHVDDRHMTIDVLPPFHGRCRHVVTPAGVAFEDFERELERGAEREAAGMGPPPTAAQRAAAEVDMPGAFDPPPFGPRATPSSNRGTPRRARGDRLLFGDPGPEPGAAEARFAAIEAEERAAKRAAGRAARSELRELDAALGPDMVNALEDYARSGVTWARDVDLRRALLAGDVDFDYVEQQATEELARREDRRDERLRQQHAHGFRTGACPCFVCGRFKPRPSSICPYCGDDPVTYGGDAHEFDMAYGYDPLGAEEQAGTMGVRGRGILVQ